jgi:NAD(P)-dependent dehydrogenase (short-subunit alcohol dehydrogenase family)
MLLGKTIVITGISSGIGARVGELAQALGADIIGVDISDPARPLDAFIKADIGSAQGVVEIVQTLPQRFDALCNVAGVSGMIGAARTLAINFYGLRELTQSLAPRLREGGAVVNIASIAGYGWRANLERAKAFVNAPGFPDLAKLLAAHEVPDGEAYPLSKELLLLWTMRAAHEALFKERGVRVNTVSPGPVATRSSRNFARSSAIRALTTTSRESAAPGPRPTLRPPCCSYARTAPDGSTAPICQSTGASKPRSTRLCSGSRSKRERDAASGRNRAAASRSGVRP